VRRHCHVRFDVLDVSEILRTFETFGSTRSTTRRHFIVTSHHAVLDTPLSAAPIMLWQGSPELTNGIHHSYLALLTHCGRVTQIFVFNTVKLGTSASSP